MMEDIIVDLAILKAQEEGKPYTKETLFTEGKEFFKDYLECMPILYSSFDLAVKNLLNKVQ